MHLNMVRVKGGGKLKFVEGPMDVVCGVVFMMVGRVSPCVLSGGGMAFVFFFGMISGLEITCLKGSILSCLCVLMTRKPAFLTFYATKRVVSIESRI